MALHYYKWNTDLECIYILVRYKFLFIRVNTEVKQIKIKYQTLKSSNSTHYRCE